MLLGGRITVYTDHKNLTFRTMSMSRAMRWRNHMNDCDVTLRYIEGEKNKLADCFSRLPRMDKISVGDKELDMIAKQKGTHVDFRSLQPPVEPEDEVFLLYDGQCYSHKQQPDIFPTLCRNDESLALECLSNLPSFQNQNNPLTTIDIQNHQLQDQSLRQRFLEQPQHCVVRQINGSDVMCHRSNPCDRQENWKICLPASLPKPTTRWYHLLLGHPGQQRLYDTIRSRFHHPGLSTACQQYRCPDNCHMCKNQGRQHGHLAARQAPLLPRNECAVDLIGPWTIKMGNKDLIFKALTSIDPVTNLMEIVRIDDKTSRHVAQKFSNSWSSRYPWPTRVIHDNGGEFIGMEFQQLLMQLGIKSVPTTVKNPQSNAIIERVHKTMGDILRVLLHTSPPTTLESANEMIDDALSTCQHACRTAVNHTMETLPGAMAFNRDVLINIPLIANLEATQGKRQKLIDENLTRANAKRIEHNYNINDKIMMVEYDPTKLEAKTHGPYTITRVFTNGTIQIRLSPGAHETVNVRKVYPHRGERQKSKCAIRHRDRTPTLVGDSVANRFAGHIW